MKDQYFGDINDYRKYGLLRGLSQEGHFRLGVCWMLTPDDGRSDGRFTEYLSRPTEWRYFDPLLFDSLTRALASQTGRTVSQVPGLGLLPGALFLEPVLFDRPDRRAQYFVEMLDAFADAELIFLDPDNGLEVKSRPYGSRGSSKYLYWREVAAAFQRGHSLLIYQHFPRQKRSAFLSRRGHEISERIPSSHVCAAVTTNVVFFLALQQTHAERGRQALSSVSQRWPGQIDYVPDLAA